MSVSITCKCGAKLKLKIESAGKRLKCPKCGRAILVPEPTPESKLAPTPKTTEKIEFWEPIGEGSGLVPGFHALCVTNKRIIIFNLGSSADATIFGLFTGVLGAVPAILWAKSGAKREVQEAHDLGLQTLIQQFPDHRSFTRKEVSAVVLCRNCLTIESHDGSSETFLFDEIDKEKIARLTTAIQPFAGLTIKPNRVPLHATYALVLPLLVFLAPMAVLLAWRGRHKQVAIGQSTVISNLLLIWSGGICLLLLWILNGAYQ